MEVRDGRSHADNVRVRTRRIGVPVAAAVLLLSAPASASAPAGSLLGPIKPAPSPSPTSATPTATIESDATTAETTSSSGGLSISVPGSVSFGSRPVGAGTLTGRLGPVQVSTSGGLLGSTGWLTKVSTSGFRSDADPSQVIAPSAVRYSAGVATGLSGVSLSACLPGSPAPLGGAATAFSCTGLSLLTGTSVTWSPTLTIEVSAGLTQGTYRGTITHSVA
jgi:hypothetical protein